MIYTVTFNPAIDYVMYTDTIKTGATNRSFSEKIYFGGKGVRVVVDATGDLLKNTLKYRPFLIKPNKSELEELFAKELSSFDQIVRCASVLQEMGAQNVLVSMAQDGAILLDSCGRVHRCPAAKGVLVNSVGAGDSMVAGFLAGADKGYEYALKLGTAAGGATAFSSGLATKCQIEKLLNEI